MRRDEFIFIRKILKKEKKKILFVPEYFEMWGMSKRTLPKEHLASHALERIDLLACMSDVYFLAIIWNRTYYLV